MKTRIFFSGHMDVEAPVDLAKHVGNAIGQKILDLPELSGNSGLFGEYTGKVIDFQLGKRVPIKEAAKTTRKARAGKVAPPAPVKSQEAGRTEEKEGEETATDLEQLCGGYEHPMNAAARMMATAPFNVGDYLYHEQFKTLHEVLEVVGDVVTLEGIEEPFSVTALIVGINKGVWRDVSFYTGAELAALAGEAQP